MSTQRIAIVGAGLAGCECALQLARRGFAVTLFEQKPETYSPAHTSPNLAELVCSNSLRSDELASGVGLIKQELRELGSALMAAADATRVPAGKALAVDRDLFSRAVTERVEAEPGITLIRAAVESLDDPALADFERVVIAAGPLASESLSASLARAVGADHLYYSLRLRGGRASAVRLRMTMLPLVKILVFSRTFFSTSSAMASRI